MKSRVTTKRGDDGQTGAIGGERYSKSHPIMECCGKLDSLRAQTALCRLEILGSGRDDAEELADFLLWILHTYFLIGAQCNDPRNTHPEYRKQDLGPVHLERVEAYQEKLEGRADIGRVFIASASNLLAAHLDLACTATRDFERGLVRLQEAVPEFKPDTVLAFVNRLSDFFFVLARYVEDGEHTELDYGRLA